MDNKPVPTLLRGFLNKNLASGRFTEISAGNYESDIMLFFRYLVMLREEHSKLEEVDNETVCRLIKDEQILSVSEDDIWAFVYHMNNDRHLKKSSLKRRISALSAFYKDLKESGHLDTNPAENVKVYDKEIKTPLFLTKKEWRSLLNAVWLYSKHRERDNCIIVFILNLGLRRAEIANLKISDIKISLEGSYVHVRGKGQKERNIPLNDSCLSAFDRYMDVRKEGANEEEDKYLFISNRGLHMSASTIYKMIKKMAVIAGLDPDITTHSLRHTFATNAISVGSINQVQKLLGHKDIKTTAIYTHALDEDLKRVVNETATNQQEQLEMEIAKETV